MNSICLIGSVWLRILSCITCLLFPVWLRILSFSTCLPVPVLPYLLVVLHLSACPCLVRGSVVHHLSDWVCPALPAWQPHHLTLTTRLPMSDLRYPMRGTSDVFQWAIDGTVWKWLFCTFHQAFLKLLASSKTKNGNNKSGTKLYLGGKNHFCHHQVPSKLNFSLRPTTHHKKACNFTVSRKQSEPQTSVA